MPTFKYLAKEQTGQTVQGMIEAQTTDEAIDKINHLGYLPVRIEEAKAGEASIPQPEVVSQPRGIPLPRVSFKKVKSAEITAFGRQLATLIRSGVPILRAISVIGDASENPSFKELMDCIHNEIKNGGALSSSLGQYPKYFSPLYLALVQAGEFSGTLDQSLLKITEYRQTQEEIFSRVRTAMAYPILMAVTGVGTIIFMLAFVMPRLMGVFSSMGGKLPLPTRILIALSTGIQHYWWLGLAAGFALAFLFWMGTRNQAQRLALSHFQLKMPLFGPLALKTEIARFARTLELLLRSGTSILQAIEVTVPVLTNEVLKKELTQALKDIREGGTLGTSLRQSKYFPLFMSNLVMVGEESGKLDDALAEVASFYEREINEAVRIVTSLMEPLMILVMGLIVGFIVVAMLLPMFELNMMVK